MYRSILLPTLVGLTFSLVASEPQQAEAQQIIRGHSPIHAVARPRSSNINLEAYRRGNNFYVVPFRRQVYVPVPAYPPLYRTGPYYGGYYSSPYSRVIITRSPAPGPRAVPRTSHYFGDPHASQSFGTQ